MDDSEWLSIYDGGDFESIVSMFDIILLSA
jgi:hypothetical protein